MWVTDLAWTLSALITTVGCFRAARAVKGHLHTAWILFGVAFGAWLVGQLVWNWNELVRGIAAPFPSLTDYFFTAFGLISIFALFALREPHVARRLTGRNFGNLGLIVCSLAVALVTALLEPIASSPHSMRYIGIALSEALSIILAFLVSVYFLWSYRWSGRTAPLVLIVMSYAVHSVVMLLYAQSLIEGDFGPSHYLNVVWIAAFSLQHWASWEQTRIAQGDATISADILATRERRIEALLPGLLLLALVIAAAAFHRLLTPRVLAIDATLLALFAIIWLIRESWIYARERRLKSLLEQSSAEVEEAKRKLHETRRDLRETEEALRLAASAGNVGLFEWDLRTNRVQYSTEWKRQLGYEDHEIADDFEEWRRRIHPDDYERARAALDEMTRHPERMLLIESRLRHRDGRYRWILTQGAVRFDKDGKPVSVRGSHVDISRQKETEAALRDSEARYRELASQLEVRVSERTAQLQDAYGELEGFAYAVSHDLKAPLRAIDGFSHLLVESARDKLSTNEREYIERVRRGALRMAALIDGLLAYSRVERRELHRKRVKLRELLDEMRAEHEEALAHIALRCEVPDLTLHVDREALMIVLRNLLDNALKFTRDTAQPSIEIGAHADQRYATIYISDNGIGFDPAYHDQIFSIFQRLHRHEQYAGTGIGLALARKAVQRMNGRIWADSAVGQGATFYVELPLGNESEQKKWNAS
jgi:PAS domain S-box-containing protein